MSIELWTLICLISITAILIVLLVCFLIIFFNFLALFKKMNEILDKLSVDLSFLSGISDKVYRVSRIPRKVSVSLFSAAASVYYAISLMKKRRKGGKENE